MRGLLSVTVAAGLSAALLMPFDATAGQSFALDSVQGLQPHDVTVAAVTYQGRKAVRVMPAVAATAELSAPKNGEGGGIVVLPATEFQDGAIEVEVAGKPRAGAVADARGFVGVAFRVAADPAKYECFYIRPTNGRADDQLRRNHSAQYISMPEYEWSRLRKESPGLYESYVDLVPGEWTKMKVEVRGTKARLYVNDAPQPVLVVNDLKHGNGKGAVALWIGLGTEAYFANLRLSN
ncbi:family 16 glycoside hydrolase [uncultured Paludibaculum sp.]|uniref:family 16 glycoside hydrolase n=1 Tax=uncultured Paludibaculum sp. TaxID=1765020 RepID=UPI002AAAC9CE|nr:family 16 glycoside hydrolase [uncultured Paludibaculum sp.]